MEIASRERLISIAMIGLCAVIGVMSFLAIVYYSQASGMNSQTVYLQSLVDQLQADKAQLDGDIAQLQADKASLENQVAALTKQNNELTRKVNQLSFIVEDICGLPDPRLAKAERIQVQKEMLSDPERLPRDTEIMR